MLGKETSTEFFTAPPLERKEESPVKLRTHAGHRKPWVQMHILSSLSHTLTYIFSLLSLHRDCFHSSSGWCTQGETAIKGPRLFIPHDQPAAWALALPCYWCSFDLTDLMSHSVRLMNTVFKCVSAAQRVILTPFHSFHSTSAQHTPSEILLRDGTLIWPHLVCNKTAMNVCEKHICSKIQALDKNIRKSVGRYRSLLCARSSKMTVFSACSLENCLKQTCD